MPPAIPDRWIPYKACGKVIEGTRIICFKVPLRKEVQVGNSEIKEIWDIKTLLETIPTLGAVVDLTNTARYYNPREFQAAGILHRKILMPGRIIPPENRVQQFMDTVDEFLGKDCDFLIGVHCTHGLNRTGYMVCRYMRDRLNIPAKTAIKRFEKARGYRIERDNYIADILGERVPPPDLNFRKHIKSHEVRPVKDDRDTSNLDDFTLDVDAKQEDGHDNYDESARRKDHEKKISKSSKRKTEGVQENWRSKARSSTDDTRDVWSSWGKDSKQKSSSRKDRTDSERSYDFKYDY